MINHLKTSTLLRLIAGVLCLFPFQCSTLSADEIDFNRDILPILKENCFDCHGPDEQESQFRADSRVALLKGGDYGEPAIVPGDIAKSVLIKAVTYENSDLEMPPDDKLNDEQIELLKRWVKEGAVWPGQMDAKIEREKSDHWSFQPVVRPPIPKIESTSPVQNEIDVFLQARLTTEGISVSPEADPRTLIRRASVVLTGLPPTPEQVADFQQAYKEDSEKAYANLVDRLLETPHFGERWAQHWLDVIRWAETNGSESNMYRKNAWIYRDYVIRSFNEDKPYDQFIREQLAGDTLGVGDATGFLVAGPHVPAATVGREESAQRQARADRMDEVLQTVGASMMGVTIGCARCHNHKFDPISIKDYYSMTAAFQDVEFGSRFPEYAADHPRRMRADELWPEIKKNRKVLRQTGPWVEASLGYDELHFNAIETTAVRVEFLQPNVRIDELEFFGWKQGNQNLVDNREPVTAKQNENVEESKDFHTLNDGEYGTMAWGCKSGKKSKERPWVEFTFDEPKSVDRMRISTNREDSLVTDYLTGLNPKNFGKYVVKVKTETGQWKQVAHTPNIEKKNKEKPERAEALSQIQKNLEWLAEEGPKPSFVARFIRPAKSHILRRGSPENLGEEVFPAALDELQGDLGLDPGAGGEKRRAAFANWLIQKENPMTSRVMVNRIWHHVFGRGIVSTTSDFGKAGAPPSHPELLDWLASEFMEPESEVRRELLPVAATNGVDQTTGDQTTRDQTGKSDAHDKSRGIGFQPVKTAGGMTGWKPIPPSNLTFVGRIKSARPTTAKPWSTKHMIRLMVMSHAFRQQSLPRNDCLAVDAGASLLWRYPPKRVEAEVIRDSILQASGSLDDSIGGRSYRIHNVKKRYAQWEVLDNHSDATWRRLIYQERMRRVDDKNFTAFDFPDCGQIRARRPVSTTPLQALNLMNSDFVVEQSKLIAERAMKESGGDETAALKRCFQLVLVRDPAEDELALCAEIAKEEGLEIVCRALINSNEFAFLP